MNCSSHDELATLDACVVHDGCDKLCVHPGSVAAAARFLSALSVYMEFVLIILHKYHQKTECETPKPSMEHTQPVQTL